MAQCPAKRPAATCGSCMYFASLSKPKSKSKQQGLNIRCHLPVELVDQINKYIPGLRCLAGRPRDTCDSCIYFASLSKPKSELKQQGLNIRLHLPGELANQINKYIPVKEKQPIVRYPCIGSILQASDNYHYGTDANRPIPTPLFNPISKVLEIIMDSCLYLETQKAVWIANDSGRSTPILQRISEEAEESDNSDWGEVADWREVVDSAASIATPILETIPEEEEESDNSDLERIPEEEVRIEESVNSDWRIDWRGVVDSLYSTLVDSSCGSGIRCAGL